MSHCLSCSAAITSVDFPQKTLKNVTGGTESIWKKALRKIYLDLDLEEILKVCLFLQWCNGATYEGSLYFRIIPE